MQRADENPEFSRSYLQRFRDLAARGEDIVGEGRLVDAMLARGSRVLDAGCGMGRIGGYLHRCGHTVVGVDVDPTLVAAARTDHPDVTWRVADLAELDLRTPGLEDPFDAAVCAGNVMLYLAPSTRRMVLQRIASHLRPGGRLAVGFGTGRGYEIEEFQDDVAAAGLDEQLRLATWDLHPWHEGADFLVALLQRPPGSAASPGAEGG